MQLNSKIFEDHENLLIGPSNIEGYYPKQSAEYIKKYNSQKEQLFEYILEIEQEIDEIESRRIKNQSKLKDYGLEIIKSEIAIELIDELIELWQQQQIISKNFYTKFQSLENFNCYNFIVEGDTIRRQNLEITKVEPNRKNSFHEIIDDKILIISGELSEEDKKRWDEFMKNPSSYKSFSIKTGIVNYNIQESELDSHISQLRNSAIFENRKRIRIVLELDDPEFIEKIEKRFPDFSFDFELLELYKEVNYYPEIGFIQLNLKESGKQVIPEKWIKIKCN